MTTTRGSSSRKRHAVASAHPGERDNALWISRPKEADLLKRTVASPHSSCVLYCRFVTVCDCDCPVFFSCISSSYIVFVKMFHLVCVYKRKS